MLDSSKDILNIIIAVSVFVFTIFFCWAIFYLAMILRQVFKGIKEMRQRFNKVDEVITALKEKIEHSASYLLLIGEGVKKLVEVIKNHTGDKKNKTARQKTK